jgi:hypothetical protein
MNLSLFVNDLTSTQQRLFSHILFTLTKMNEQSSCSIHDTNCESFKMKCSLPTSHSSLRRTYIDGRFSINNNLPCPTVKMLSNHSYVLVKESIADFFGHGNHELVKFHHTTPQHSSDKNNFSHVTNVFDTLAGRSILRNCKQRMISQRLYCSSVIPVILLFWSDDFEPNKSIKSNRQSVWIKTMTIIVQSTSSTKISSSTYPVAIGKKDIPHEEVEQCLIDELESLMKGPMTILFSNNLKSPVHVHAETFCILNDQPERRSGLGLAAGNAKYHRRWGFSCDIKCMIGQIPACTQCMSHIENSIYSTHVTWNNMPSCSKCTRWMGDRISSDRLLEQEWEHMDGNDLRAQTGPLPFKLRLDTLTGVIEQVHDGIVSSNFSAKVAEEILHRYCLSSKMSDNAIQFAKNCLIYKNALLHKDLVAPSGRNSGKLRRNP